ncbi:hypothetical protein [Streptomyces sp. NPDC004528]|uniref:hypothetical protein n=1 Tax=Streptomyces sp. NPDC004528 TaxID=3154550 RepID=UPI0033A04488
MVEQPQGRCQRLVGYDDEGREILCGKPVIGHPLHVEINGSRALDLTLCADDKAAWYEHNAPWFDRATTAKVALFKLFEDHKGDLFTSAQIRTYLREALAARRELFKGPAEIELVEALQDRGKLSFAAEDLFKEIRLREEQLTSSDEWEDVKPSEIRNYLNARFDNQDPRLKPADLRLIAGMPDTGMPSQPLIDLYARLRREDLDNAASAEESASRS